MSTGVQSQRVESRGGVFFGWFVLGASFVGMVFGPASVLLYSFGVFTGPLEHDFGWSRAQISIGASIIVLVSVLTQPLQGMLVDRFGVRRVVLPSIPVFTGALALLYFLNGDIRLFYASWVLITFCGMALWNGSYNKLMAAWYDRKLGLAVGLIGAGQGVGAALVPAICQALITKYGWRIGYVGLALITLIFSLTFSILFLYDKPSDKNQFPDGDRERAPAIISDSGLESYSFKESARHGSFWIIIGTFFLLGTMSTAIVAHQVPMLVDRHVPPEKAAFVATAFGLSLIVGRIAAGYLLDRFFAPRVLAAFLLGPVMGLSLFALGVGSGGSPFAWAALIGLGVGAEIDVLGYLIPRYFGRKAYALLYGVVLSAFQIGGAIGAAALGIIRTNSGSYSAGLWGIATTTFLAIVLISLLGPYTFRAPAKRPSR